MILKSAHNFLSLKDSFGGFMMTTKEIIAVDADMHPSFEYRAPYP